MLRNVLGVVHIVWMESILKAEIESHRVLSKKFGPRNPIKRYKRKESRKILNFAIRDS